MSGVQSPRPDYVLKAAELVEALGGDPGRFLEECDVVQFVFLARPVEARAAAGPGLAARAPEARPAAAPPPAAALPEAGRGPWAGSRRIRVLVVPDVQDPADCLGPALASLASSMHAKRDVTLAVVLPTALLEAPPPAVASIAGAPDLDLLLTELPRTPAGWEALVAGATMVVTTSPRPEVEPVARRLGAELHDARRDPALAGPPPVPPAVAAIGAAPRP
jgi:hypothetical protein